MTMRDWFYFSDKDVPPYNPISDPLITVEKLWQNQSGEFEALDWQKEDWLIRSALVPVDELIDAVRVISTAHDLSFGTGWDAEDEFDFGVSTSYRNLHLYPITRFTKHPVSQECDIDLAYEFLTYHALQKRNQTQYFHPIDNIVVAEATIDSHELYEDSGRVVIHIDYLRDFLAATKMGLFISVIADRFANANTEEELEISHLDEFQIDNSTWIRTDIHTPKFTHHEYYRGRSTLRRNFVIAPYERPKYERNPWLYYGENLFAEEDYPQFIINSEGEKRILPRDVHLGEYIQQGIGDSGYLYFRPEVLQKFLLSPEYSVYFHMRNWGVASLPGNRGSIDVGINSHGIVNAFAPDIAGLSPSEQAYWSSFSSLPSGEVCEEMFQTRIQLSPPNSPGIVDVIRDSRLYLSEVVLSKYSVDLFSDLEPNNQELGRLSIGPISINKYHEVLELAKIFYGWVIETMQIVSLRSVLNSVGGSVDNDWRQIKLIEQILIAGGLNMYEAQSITAPLAGLKDLRIGSAHIGSPALESAFQLLGSQTLPQTPRAGWNLCVDAVANSLITFSDSI